MVSLKPQKFEYKCTKELLEGEEGYDVEFKESVNGVKPKYFVAFANSKNGGTILVGVSEEAKDGQEPPVVVGCNIGDRSKRKLITRAQNCRPPVDIEINEETLDGEDFYRIDIEPGNSKPYCTEKGKYKIRDDGNVKGLHPEELLEIYMEEESKKFLKRFEEATKDLVSDFESMEKRLSLFKERVNENLNEIQYKTESAGNWGEDAHLATEELKNRVIHLEKKIDKILSKTEE